MEKSSFFNSVNGDRKYKASDFAAFFNSLVTNGVFPNPSTNLQIISNSNMTVTVKSGKAWINGYCYINDSDLILPITVADGVLNRIDRVVIQYNTVNREINAIVKKGTFASTPIAPVLQRDADAYELGIVDIAINAGATSIAQANITDLRMNTTYCGWVNSLIQADTTAIFNQYLDWYNTKKATYDGDFTNWTIAKKSDYDTWTTAEKATYDNWYSTTTGQLQSDFTTWFNTIKNTLGSDVAGNLQNEIGTLSSLTTTAKDNLVNAVNEEANKINILNGTGDVQEKANKSDLVTKLDKNGGTLQNYSEITSSNTTATGAVTLDVTNGNVFNLTLTGAITLTFTTPVASGKECSFSLYLNQGSTAYSVTFPSSLKWDNDSTPDLSAVNKTNIMVFTTVNGGTRWYGRLAMGNLVT